MAGYIEAMTDPSYRGQILVFTYPLIGNYGVPAPRPEGSLDLPYESSRIQIQGLVVQNLVDTYSHHSATRSLAQWLASERIPYISGIDTRTLMRFIAAHHLPISLETHHGHTPKLSAQGVLSHGILFADELQALAEQVADDNDS